ncbi:DUF2076 domain-containing protein [Massilia sp. LXY-6]|uniref:DUF2076 domain-containing protein n=1 Tax=Massilia sp. LXY-6 TaxID=3379823 RepID=UPI003EE3FCFB
MSPQDSQMLHDFLSQLIQARGIQKDPEADALIQRAVAQQPDAAYLLVQRSLLLEQALNNAKSQVAQLQDQLSQQRSGQRDDNGKFLDANTWGNSGGSRPVNAPMQQAQRDYPQAQYQQPPYQPQYQPQYQQQPPAGGMFGSRSGGFLGGGMLGSIAATAAGVAAGNFLFQGIENMFGHHEQGGHRLLNSDDPANNLFSDQSGSSLANQAGLGDVGQSLGGSGGNNLLDSGSGDVASEGLFDSGTDDGGSLDNNGGFFDGDGSDEGLFS